MKRFASQFAIACAASATIAAAAYAQSAPAPGAASDPTGKSQQGDVSVTIYNGDTALVQDVRQLPFPRGRTRIEFPDVSSRIRPETLSFAADGTGIVEQNFDFDLLTPAKLMEKAVGETITLVRTNPATGKETRERAKVLSVAGGVVVQIGDRIEVLRDDGLPVRAVFDRVPNGLRARPTLSVTVDSSRAGTRPASIRYLTRGLGWQADYVSLYDEVAGTIDMQGWVTLTNNTGTTFEDANTVLVAGSPAGASNGGYRPAPTRGQVRSIGTESAGREQLADYYLYPLAARTTIANAQTKQVSFMDVQGVPAQKIYARTVNWLQSDSQPVKAESRLAFSSSRDGGLGDALPAGTVRFYQRDAGGTPQFIGEDQIGHTPMGSTMSLKLGDAFDVAVEAAVTARTRIDSEDYVRSARYRVIEGDNVRQIDVQRAQTFWRTTMRYKVTNAKDTPVEVEVTQAGLDRGWISRDFRVVNETIKGEQQNLDQRVWSVPVPANGETVLSVTYETRY
ncbi:DUF4139 domain-containing protein [Croceicoccus mobilis]|uniref:DUF4139 domain-containing protein n=1 Tax=Croceicoccus mobilis TaxID=1703339 RepID=A0A916Z7C3_9SPHN|nr:DUF4139 domain-containing protein [Croceicoccus mobilis]GGD79691.1 hypothetical protein GCM10010990_32010 [Croceicoccus mobilis]